jgi:hypothetical protein
VASGYLWTLSHPLAYSRWYLIKPLLTARPVPRFGAGLCGRKSKRACQAPDRAQQLSVMEKIV